MAHPAVLPHDFDPKRLDHLPVAAAYCEKIGLGRIIDEQLQSQMEVSPGQVVKAMVLDVLGGRQPLYQLQERFEMLDCELLLGKGASPDKLHDVCLGRVLDALCKAGTMKLFSEISFNAAKVFELDTRHLHFDTTSVSVWGDYEQCDDGAPAEGPRVTYGHSKDHRPDLKQFLVHALCTEQNIPLMGNTEDGNASDKKVNTKILQRVNKIMADGGLERNAWVYIADSAFVTEANLNEIGDNYFISRLPKNYGACQRLIEEACLRDDWEDIGVLAESDTSERRPHAYYRAMESAVELHGHEYRAVVVHSDAYDRRRQKSIDRRHEKSAKEAQQLIREASRRTYACRADAESAGIELQGKAPECHRLEVVVSEKPVYARGRPPADGERKVDRIEYLLEVFAHEDRPKVERMRMEAGCFVLICNLSTNGEMGHSTREILEAYKEQHGVERNFAFLKDPLIVNDLFLKKTGRIEALGMILLISLLVWSLMERTMRKNLKETGKQINGWVKRKTTRPTSYMMTRKFLGITVVEMDGKRYLTRPLKDVQLQYLEILEVPPEMITRPPEKSFLVGRKTCRI